MVLSLCRRKIKKPELVTANNLAYSAIRFLHGDEWSEQVLF